MWTKSKTKIERKARIKALLLSNDKAVLRGIVAIYSLQTEIEKVNFNTKNENNIGFNAYDAGLMSSLAVQIKESGSLSYKQMNIARQRIVKYTRQLADIAEQFERKHCA